MSKKFGFTLAEVLITLGIIGVVASMTIPTLMNKTSGAEFKAGFKKMVSSLNQAITMNVALEGMDFSTLSAGVTDGSIYYMFITRLNTVKTTNGAVTDMGTAFTGSNYTLYFNDGMVISFPQTAASCVKNVAADGSYTVPAGCEVLIDVNGTKKPNKLSVATTGATTAGVFDQFKVQICNQEVLPLDDSAKYVLYN